ncbi:hypothetical protein WJ438_10115 [Streptomyces sp. GD-15H]|uniref:hypothetical protein n=1 Tax=Streptomyces sp. GD-15H TaxID=3129112 RepID=UPI003244DED6
MRDGGADTELVLERRAEPTDADPRREIHIYPFNGHEGGDAVHVRRRLDRLNGLLGSRPTPERHR